jgi:alternate F1F0 ATPase F1 subunit epsilon
VTLEVFVPSRVYRFFDIGLVDIESVSGHLTLLPRHIDCVAELVAGLVRLRGSDEEERYLGADGGTLVKMGDRVMISTPRAVVGRELGQVHSQLEERRRERAEQAKDAQHALARLELQLARSIFEQETHSE